MAQRYDIPLSKTSLKNETRNGTSSRNEAPWKFISTSFHRHRSCYDKLSTEAIFNRSSAAGQNCLRFVHRNFVKAVIRMSGRNSGVLQDTRRKRRRYCAKITTLFSPVKQSAAIDECFSKEGNIFRRKIDDILINYANLYSTPCRSL